MQTRSQSEVIRIDAVLCKFIVLLHRIHMLTGLNQKEGNRGGGSMTNHDVVITGGEQHIVVI